VYLFLFLLFFVLLALIVLDILTQAQVRILLVSTGPKLNIMHGYHFTIRPNYIMRLPKFEIYMPQNKGLQKHEIAISQMYVIF